MVGVCESISNARNLSFCIILLHSSNIWRSNWIKSHINLDIKVKNFIMLVMQSVLSNRKNLRYSSKLYPYIIIDDSLPLDYYNKLNEEFPSFDKIIGNNEFKENCAYRYNTTNSLKDDQISDTWKEFIRDHTSYSFLKEFYEIFGDTIKKLYKIPEDKLPNQKNIGIRFDGNHYFNLDCQFVINTPTSGETSVIEPHLDNPVEFYAALLYMKDPKDNSTGGNLTTYSFKDKPSFYGKSRVRENKVNLIEEIEYKENRLVMFLNTPFSIHGVSKRSKTVFYRKYINIIGEFNFELFNFRNFLEK